MRRGWVIGALLVSLGANAYLLWFDAEATQVAEPARRVASPSVPRRPPSRPVPPQISSADRAALEVRLAAAEERLETILSADAKFARASEPDPEAEAQLRPYLDKLFDGAAYALECRERFCRIAAPEADVEWQNKLQVMPELAGAFKLVAIGREVHVELADDADAAARRTLFVPIYALLESRALADCRRDHPSTGKLAMSIKVVAGRFVVRALGPLADHAIGVCVRRALEDIAAATPIPPELQSTAEVPFPVPLE